MDYIELKNLGMTKGMLITTFKNDEQADKRITEVPAGDVLDMDEVIEMVKSTSLHYGINIIVYDPWNTQVIADELKGLGFDIVQKRNVKGKPVIDFKTTAKKLKKVALVGYAPSWKDAPYNDPDIEIWIMNDMYDFAPRWDRLFDIHMIDEIKTRKSRGEGNQSHYEMLKTLEKPIYMQQHFEEIPLSVEFPLAPIIEEYWTPAMGDKIFLTCSVAHMLALAIYEEYDEIQLYGIHEAVDDEYSCEMPSVLYWLGVAYGKGITIKISLDSPLLKGYFVYGYEDQKDALFHKQLQYDIDRTKKIQEEAIKKQQFYHDEECKCIGAMAMLEHIKKLTSEI
jgi:hypothetical protein